MRPGFSTTGVKVQSVPQMIALPVLVQEEKEEEGGKEGKDEEQQPLCFRSEGEESVSDPLSFRSSPPPSCQQSE